MSVVEYLALIVFWFAPPVVCALKGKWGFAAVGLAFHMFALVGMCRLAKPRSVWARKWYGPGKRATSSARFAKA
jgi:hypothetical protein